MDVKIGVANSSREIAFDVDLTQEEVIEKITKAKSDGYVSFVDTKETTWFLRQDAILYVEFGKATSRRVGFVS